MNIFLHMRPWMFWVLNMACLGMCVTLSPDLTVAVKRIYLPVGNEEERERALRNLVGEMRIMACVLVCSLSSPLSVLALSPLFIVFVLP